MSRLYWFLVWQLLILLVPFPRAFHLNAYGFPSRWGGQAVPKEDADVQKAMNRSTAPHDYKLQCGETPTQVVIKGFQVIDLERLIKDLSALSKELSKPATFQPKVGTVTVTVILGDQGADCAVASNNSRKKGARGGNAIFIGGDDVRVIVMGGKGGDGCAGWIAPAFPDERNLNGGDGGIGGIASAAWGDRGVVLALGGRGGDGGSFTKHAGLHPGKVGRPGSGGPGEFAFLQWNTCSAVGARGGDGGFPNNSSMTAMAGPPQANNVNPASPDSSQDPPTGGHGGNVHLKSPVRPNTDLLRLAPAARGGNGRQGAAAHVKKPFITTGGLGGDVFRTGAGTADISSQGGTGGPGTNGPGINGQVIGP